MLEKRGNKTNPATRYKRFFNAGISLTNFLNAKRLLKIIAAYPYNKNNVNPTP